MPTATVTTDVMKALPAALRPNPYSIDDEVMTLASRGWTVTQVVEQVIKQGATTPGLAVTIIRRLLDYPAPNDRPTPAPTKPVGHQPCEEHGKPCELCYCTPGPPQHHTNARQEPLWAAH